MQDTWTYVRYIALLPLLHNHFPCLTPSLFNMPHFLPSTVYKTRQHRGLAPTPPTTLPACNSVQSQTTHSRLAPTPPTTLPACDGVQSQTTHSRLAPPPPTTQREIPCSRYRPVRLTPAFCLYQPANQCDTHTLLRCSYYRQAINQNDPQQAT